jgi:hypothetical protein
MLERICRDQRRHYKQAKKDDIPCAAHSYHFIPHFAIHIDSTRGVRKQKGSILPDALGHFGFIGRQYGSAGVVFRFE